MDASVYLLVCHGSFHCHDLSVFCEQLLGMLFPYYRKLISGSVTVVRLCLCRQLRNRSKRCRAGELLYAQDTLYGYLCFRTKLLSLYTSFYGKASVFSVLLRIDLIPGNGYLFRKALIKGRLHLCRENRLLSLYSKYAYLLIAGDHLRLCIFLNGQYQLIGLHSHALVGNFCLQGRRSCPVRVDAAVFPLSDFRVAYSILHIQHTV